jgi:hypothetical protein
MQSWQVATGAGKFYTPTKALHVEKASYTNAIQLKENLIYMSKNEIVMQNL